MPSYVANHEVAAHEAALKNYAVVHASWTATQEQRAEQLLPPDAPPLAPPTPEPQPPPDPPTYESRKIAKAQTIKTVAGDALVVPPRIVLTSSSGAVFALSEDELALGYTEVVTQPK